MRQRVFVGLILSVLVIVAFWVINNRMDDDRTFNPPTSSIIPAKSCYTNTASSIVCVES